MSSLNRFYFLLFCMCIPVFAQASSLDIDLNTDTNKIKFNPGFVYKNNFLAAARISKQQAAKIANQQVAGRVLKVSLHKNSYRVKIVSKSGDVVSVLVNATTGQIIKQ